MSICIFVNDFQKGETMRIENIVQVELPALSRTIREYTTDNYISSYAEQISSIIYPQEREKLAILISKLLEWYQNEIDVIKKGEYIHSKSSHEKSFLLLKEMKELLEKE